MIAGALARSITRPLRTLLAATRKLIRDPETKEGFPLEVTSNNESADLTRAFNLMVTSMEEQRAGLSDTLALLDSMLENAPIGFAFFDRKFRYVRVNQFLAEMNQVPIGRHLGRTIAEMLPGPAAEMLQGHVQSVFETGRPVVQFELNTALSDDVTQVRSWLINVYPVKGYSITIHLKSSESQQATPKVSLLDESAKIVTSRLGQDRFRVAGTAEFNGFNRDIRADRIKPLVDWTRRNFGAIDTSNTVPWSGLRPMMPDMMPFVRAGRRPGIFYNTGHGHLGWTLSAATAQKPLCAM